MAEHRPDRPDRPFVVEPAAARPGGGSRLPVVALVAVLVVVGGLAAWGLAVAPGPAPSRAPVAQASPAGGSPSPDATEPATPVAIGPDGITVPDTDEAFAVLASAIGFRQCPMWRGFGEGSTVSAGDVAAALDGTRDPAGLYPVDDAQDRPQPVWVGGTTVDAVAGFGGEAVVRVEGDGDAAWTSVLVGDGWQAVRVAPLEVPGVGTAWRVSDRATPAPYCMADSIGGPPARVVTVGETGDAAARLLLEAAWSVCRTWQRMEVAREVPPEAIDAAADRIGFETGPAWLSVPVPGGSVPRVQRVWVGDDPARAGTQHGSRLVVIGGEGARRTAWMASELDGRPLGVAFAVVRTPGGRTGWLPTSSAEGVTGDCEVDAASGAVAPSLSEDSGDSSPVELLRGGASARAMLAERLAWTGCRMSELDAFPSVAPADDVDRAAAAQRIESGWLSVPAAGDAGGGGWLVFLGEDVSELARTMAMPLVALDGSASAWIGDEVRAEEWAVLRTPRGRTAWQVTGARVWPDGCVLPDVRGELRDLPVRSLTCWTDADRCREAVASVARLARDAFIGPVDAAVGLGRDCPPNARCAWDGPNQPVYVSVVPAPWPDGALLRAWVVSARRLSGAGMEISAGGIPDAVRDQASLPSLALPGEDGLDAGCPASGIEGVLVGEPWDPRVAWVGGSHVAWPPATRVRFDPAVTLVSADGRAYHEGDVLQLSGTAGVEGQFAVCRVTRVESATPLPSAP